MGGQDPTALLAASRLRRRDRPECGFAASTSSAGARPGSVARTASIAASSASPPMISSTSSSTNRPTTRLRATASTSSRLSSTVVPSALSMRFRRSCRIVTTSTSGASPQSSRIRERASEAGQSRGCAVRSAGPSSSSRRWTLPCRATNGRLHSDRRALGGLPQSCGEAGPSERAVDRVDVAVLDLRGPNGRAGREAGDVVGREIAVPGRGGDHAVFELDLDRAAPMWSVAVTLADPAIRHPLAPGGASPPRSWPQAREPSARHGCRTSRAGPGCPRCVATSRPGPSATSAGRPRA